MPQSIRERSQPALGCRSWLAVLSIHYSLSSADRHLWDTTTSKVACPTVWTAASAATCAPGDRIACGDLSNSLVVCREFE